MFDRIKRREREKVEQEAKLKKLKHRIRDLENTFDEMQEAVSKLVIEITALKAAVGVDTEMEAHTVGFQAGGKE